MTMRNEQVAESWRKGEMAYSKNMSTDGLNLYSYGLKIGYTFTGIKVLYLYMREGRFVSMTTSQHVGMGMSVADVVVHPDTNKIIRDYRPNRDDIGILWKVYLVIDEAYAKNRNDAKRGNYDSQGETISKALAKVREIVNDTLEAE
jgi:hypothetical protein